jgi:lysophospholipase L1-like esterase
VITSPAATTVLCFGDSNTNGMPSDDENYVRLPPDVRWTGRLQDLLGGAYSIIEEGLSGRTTDVDYDERPGANGRTYFLPCLQTHHPLDVVVIMLGTNDLKTEFDRPAAAIAGALHGYLDDIAANVTDRTGAAPSVILVSPILLDANGWQLTDPAESSFDRASVAKSERLAAEIARVAQARGVRFADAARVARAGGDGVHLSLPSHAALAELLAAAIKDS